MKDSQTAANENGNGKLGKAAGDNGRFAVRALPIDYFNKYSCQWENVEPSNLNIAKREINKIIKRKQRENDKPSQAKTTQRGATPRQDRQTKFYERICQKVKSAI